MTEFKNYERKPSFSRAFQFLSWEEIPPEGGLRFQSEGQVIRVWNEFHQSWIEFKMGDYIVGVPGDFYPHERVRFEKSHIGFGCPDCTPNGKCNACAAEKCL